VDAVAEPLIVRKLHSAKNRTRDFWLCSQEVWPLDFKILETPWHVVQSGTGLQQRMYGIEVIQNHFPILSLQKTK
jgi:hypothetical protein